MRLAFNSISELRDFTGASQTGVQCWFPERENALVLIHRVKKQEHLEACFSGETLMEKEDYKSQGSLRGESHGLHQEKVMGYIRGKQYSINKYSINK